MARTRQTARKSTGGIAPRMVHGTGVTATVAAPRASVPLKQAERDAIVAAELVDPETAYPDDPVDLATPGSVALSMAFPLVGADELEHRARLAATMTAAAIGGEDAYFAKFLALASWDDKQRLWSDVLAEENEHRKLFAQQRDSAPEIQDACVGLVRPVAREPPEIRRGAPLFEEERNIPVIFPIVHHSVESAAIATQREFDGNWRAFTGGCLHGLDWSNVFAAGGSVLACVQPTAHEDPMKFFSKHYAASDIDLFIYGLDEETAKGKMISIFETVKRNIPFETVAFRTANAITIVSQYPYRYVQIVLRLYKSPAEILAGFDVDSSSIGYDGKDVWMTRRAHMAMTSGVNTIDMSRRSPTYEIRLAKYAERGFEVRVPGLDRYRVDPQIYLRSFEKVNGLGRLLALENTTGAMGRLSFKEAERRRAVRPQHERAGVYQSRSWKRANNLKSFDLDASDYQTVFLPFGPGYTASSIKRIAFKNDKQLNNPYLMARMRSTIHHQHPMFFGTMEQVILDCCGQCPPLPDDYDSAEDRKFVRGEVAFIQDDPGRQAVGSFNPIDDDEWATDAIIPDFEGELVAILAHDDDVALSALFEGKKFDPDRRDWLGRTPLQYATMCNAFKCVKFLLSETEAKISYCTPNGQTLLHICAEHGLVEIAELVLRKNAENIAKKEAREKAAQESLAAPPQPLQAKSPSSTEPVAAEAEMNERNDDIDPEDALEYESVTHEEAMDSDDGDGKKKKGRSKQKVEIQVVDADAPRGGAEEEVPMDDVLDLDWIDWDYKMTPLHFACLHAQLEMIRLLIDHGASKTKSIKIQNSSLVTLYTLGALCVEPSMRKNIIKTLIECSVPLTLVNENYETIFHTLPNSDGSGDAVVLLFDTIKEMSETHKLAQRQLRAAINFLDNSMRSPVAAAAGAGNLRVLQLYIENGGKVNYDAGMLARLCKRTKRNTTPSLEDVESPLETAIEAHNADCAKLLLQNGAFIKRCTQRLRDSWNNSTPFDFSTIVTVEGGDHMEFLMSGSKPAKGEPWRSQTLFGRVQLALRSERREMKDLVEDIKSIYNVELAEDMLNYDPALADFAASEDLSSQTAWGYSLPNAENSWCTSTEFLAKLDNVSAQATTKQPPSLKMKSVYELWRDWNYPEGLLTDTFEAFVLGQLLGDEPKEKPKSVLTLSRQALVDHFSSIDDEVLSDEGYIKSGYDKMTMSGQIGDYFRKRGRYYYRSRWGNQNVDDKFDKLRGAEIRVRRLFKLREQLLAHAPSKLPLLSEAEIADEWVDIGKLGWSPVKAHAERHSKILLEITKEHAKHSDLINRLIAADTLRISRGAVARPSDRQKLLEVVTALQSATSAMEDLMKTAHNRLGELVTNTILQAARVLYIGMTLKNLHNILLEIIKVEDKPEIPAKPEVAVTNATEVKLEVERRNPFFLAYTPMTTPAVEQKHHNKTKNEYLQELEETFALGEAYHALYELIWRGAKEHEIMDHIAANNLLIYVEGPVSLTPFHVAVIQRRVELIQPLVKLAISQHNPNETDEEKEIREAKEARKEAKRLEKPSIAVVNNYENDSDNESDDSCESDASDKSKGDTEDDEEADPNKELEGGDEVLGDDEILAQQLREKNRKVAFKLPAITHKTPVELLWTRARLDAKALGPKILSAGVAKKSSWFLDLNVVEMCIVRSDEDMLGTLLQAIDTLEFTVLKKESSQSSNTVTYSYYVEKLPSDLLRQTFARGGDEPQLELNASFTFETKGINLVLQHGTPEFFKMFIGEMLGGADIDVFLGFQRKTEEEKLKETLHAGAKMSGGRLKDYYGLDPDAALKRKKEATGETTKRVHADGSESKLIQGLANAFLRSPYNCSVLKSAIINSRNDLIPVLLDTEEMTGLVLRFARANPRSPWSDTILGTAKANVQLLARLMFGFVPQQEARRVLSDLDAEFDSLPSVCAMSPLRTCVSYNLPSSIDVLTASMDAETLRLAAYQLETPQGLRPFHAACTGGRVKCIERLLAVDKQLGDNGRMLASVDLYRSWTGLHFASYYGHHEVVQFLVNSLGGAGNELARGLLTTKSNRYGYTPLMLAASQGRHKSMKILIEACKAAGEWGAFSDAEEAAGMQALHLAVRKELADLVGTLTEEMTTHAATINASTDTAARVDAGAAAAGKRRARVHGDLAIANEDAVGLTPYQTASNVLKRELQSVGMAAVRSSAGGSSSKAERERLHPSTRFQEQLDVMRKGGGGAEAGEEDKADEPEPEAPVARDVAAAYLHVKGALVARAEARSVASAAGVVEPAVAQAARRAATAAAEPVVPAAVVAAFGVALRAVATTTNGGGSVGEPGFTEFFE